MLNQSIWRLLGHHGARFVQKALLSPVQLGSERPHKQAKAFHLRLKAKTWRRLQDREEP